MKVAIAVDAARVRTWQRAAIAALRALDGVAVSLIDVPGSTEPPLRGAAARLGGPVLATAPIQAEIGPLDGYDVVLDLTGAELAADAPHGVWSYRLGAGGRGLPFAEDVASGAKIAQIALLVRGGSRPGTLRVGRFPIPLWYPTLLRLALGEAARWPATFVAAIRDGVVLEPVAADPSAAPRNPKRTHPIRLGAALAARFAGGMRDAFFMVDRWNVGLAPGEPRDIVDGTPLAVTWLADPPSRTFVADPFVVERDGLRVLFIEEFSYARDRGVIDALVLDEHGAVVRRTRALDVGTHLSFPFPLEIDGELYIVPENSAAGEVALYRCVAFPDRWERSELLFAFPGVDTTVFPHDGRWWALCTRYDTGPSVALHAYHAPSPRGPWQPHALNPVVIDVSCARPAGPPFVVDGVLYRTGQDCSATYGGAVVLARIDALTPTAYAERFVRRIEAPPGPFPDGFHTISFARGTIVVDGKRTHYDPRNIGRAARAVGARLRRLAARAPSHRAAQPHGVDSTDR